MHPTMSLTYVLKLSWQLRNPASELLKALTKVAVLSPNISLMEPRVLSVYSMSKSRSAVSASGAWVI